MRGATAPEKEFTTAVARRVNEAITAEAHGPPAAVTLIEDVFAEVTPQLREQLGATGRGG